MRFNGPHKIYREIMIKEVLKQYKNKFSKTQLDLAKKIEVKLGEDAAICLVSLLIFERTSQREIDVITKLIEQFSPIEVKEFTENPNKVTLAGIGPKRHRIEIIPQFKVKNPFPQGRTWSLDLVIKLYRKIGEEHINICSINVEYDGDPSHYLESGIIKAYMRDASVVSELSIQTLRISPNAWKKDDQFFVKAIKKIFENSIKKIEKVQYHTIKATQAHSSYLSEKKRVECPICTGGGMLADEYCPLCQGVGRISKELTINLDLSEYEFIDCPECKKRSEPYRSCTICIGKGSITREKAVEIAKKRA